MRNKINLAIVIPAYKPDYFDATIASIARQTCKAFTLYIGDDASKADLYSIVKKYESQINIVYKRFDKNLGEKDLVAHWNRCVDMTGDEEWAWLFSDDDLMHPKCVEEFYKEISNGYSNDLFHFNVQIIDGHGKLIRKEFPFPDVLDTKSFFMKRMSGELNSFIVEYIFNKKTFIEKGRFQSFELAWYTDDATWIKIGNSKGIKSIHNCEVSWRKSKINISENKADKSIAIRKINANLAFFQWVKDQSEVEGIDKTQLHQIFHNRFIMQLVIYTQTLKYAEIYEFMEKFHQLFHVKSNSLRDANKVLFYKTKARIGSKIRMYLQMASA